MLQLYVRLFLVIEARMYTNVGAEFAVTPVGLWLFYTDNFCDQSNLERCILDDSTLATFLNIIK
jgi:hypothetical protein